METERSSETLVFVYQNKRRHVAQYRYVNIHTSNLANEHMHFNDLASKRSVRTSQKTNSISIIHS
jgi:hypothetical protein